MYAIFCVLRGNATYFLNYYYSGPSVSVASTSSDSTNLGTNIFGEKIPDSTEKQNFNFNYFCSLYIILGIISNLEILKLGEDVPRFGEGNGTPLQYSSLENPMDGGA